MSGDSLGSIRIHKNKKIYVYISFFTILCIYMIIYDIVCHFRYIYLLWGISKAYVSVPDLQPL